MLLSQFILLMILAAHQSGKMLQRQGLLKSNAESWSLSAMSMRQLMEKLADQSANLTPKQRQKVVMRQLGAVVFAKFLGGNKSGQPNRIMLQLPDLRHLMRMGIPRQIQINLEPRLDLSHEMIMSVLNSLQNESVVFDPTGALWKTTIQDRQLITKSYSHFIQSMIMHITKEFYAVMTKDGCVYIGRTDCPHRMLVSIYQSSLEARATTIAFDSSQNMIVVGTIDGHLRFFCFTGNLESSCAGDIRVFQMPIFEIQPHPSKSVFLITSTYDHTCIRQTCIISSLDLASNSCTVSSVSDALNFMGYNSCGYPLNAVVSTCLSENVVVVGCCNRGMIGFFGLTIKPDSFDLEFIDSLTVIDESYPINGIAVSPSDPSFIIISVTVSTRITKFFLVKLSLDRKSSEIIWENQGTICMFEGNYIILVKDRCSIILYNLSGKNMTQMLTYTTEKGSIKSCVLDTENRVIVYSVEGSAERYFLRLV